MRFFLSLALCFLSFPSFALTVGGALTQGGYLLGQTEVGAQVWVNDHAVWVDAEGSFFAGLHRTHGPEVVVKTRSPHGVEKTQTLLVSPRTFKVQHIKGVPSKTVTPDPAQVARSKKDSAAIRQARAQQERFPFFKGDFIMPTDGPTTGVYGSSRSYNGQERSWHKGHDIAAPTGTPVKAAASGIVRLAQDTFFNGNLVIIDHGAQVFTIYAHLDSMAVDVGKRLKQGDVLGTVGSTGRSTGPHLHWGLYWKNMALDPQLIVPDEK